MSKMGKPNAHDEVDMIQIADGRVRSLAEVEPDELVRVERILYRVLRELCATLGVHEGDQLICRGSFQSRVVLQSETGRRVLIDRDWARFIRIRTCDG
jgi:hypothetical protein